MKKVRWGVLSTAKIGVEKVIPAIQQAQNCEVSAIASRHSSQAEAVAGQLGIEKAYSSYEALLADDSIDAVYIPLPNHLHVPWSIKAMQAGKHVLCEKPIGLTVVESENLLEEARRHPHLKVMEAFMYRFHPHWQFAKQLVSEGKIGDLKTINSFFSYCNTDAEDIRNKADIGGGGLMDIGCYCISLSRFLFDSEPLGVLSVIENDPVFKTDRIASGILSFQNGTSTFTCSTQLSPYQRVNIFGTTGRIEIEIPFNAPPDKACRLFHQQGDEISEISFDICDQYSIQADLFAQAIIDDTEVPTPLDDAVANMRVLEAVKANAIVQH